MASKRKSKAERVREMSVFPHSFGFDLSNVSQTSSFIISFLSIQHRYVSSAMDFLPRGRLPSQRISHDQAQTGGSG